MPMRRFRIRERRVCRQCGDPFTATRRDEVLCSPACGRLWHRAAARAARRARQSPPRQRRVSAPPRRPLVPVLPPLRPRLRLIA